MIELKDKTVRQLRGLLEFYRRRQDNFAVRAINDELAQRGKGLRKRERSDDEEVNPDDTVDPLECNHEWLMDPIERYRFRCRICGVYGYRNSDFHPNASTKLYVCQHTGCRRPVTRINERGERFCREHYRDKSPRAGWSEGEKIRHGRRGPGGWHTNEFVKM